MLASKNTIPAVTSTAGGYHWLNVLAGELAVRLRESREVTPGLWPKTIVLTHRSALSANPWQHRSVQMPFPFTRHLDADYIAKFGRKLWDDSLGKHTKLKLTNISLQLTGLHKLETGQRGIAGFLKGQDGVKKEKEEEGRKEMKRERSNEQRTPEPPKKKGKMPKSVEAILSRGGTPTASTFAPMEISSSSSGSTTPAPTETKPALLALRPEPAREESDEKSWTCPKCSERFALPEHVPASEAAAWIAVSRQEHDDFHFALSLEQDGSPTRPSVQQSSHAPHTDRSGSSARQGKTKKRGSNGDIMSFFAAKR